MKNASNNLKAGKAFCHIKCPAPYKVIKKKEIIKAYEMQIKFGKRIAELINRKKYMAL